MSSPLPPPSPPSNGPSGVAPPAWQSSPAAAPKSSRGKVIAGIVVAVVVIAAVVIVVASRGSDPAGPIDAKAANSGLQAVYDDVDFDAGSNTADLDRCPFGRVVTLVRSLPKSVSVQDDVISGTDSAVATVDPSTVQCNLVADDPGDLVGEGPAQITFIAELDPSNDYVAELDGSTVHDEDLSIDSVNTYRGGDLFGYCGDDPELLRFCGASWDDKKDHIAISVTMRGAVTLNMGVDSLKAVLDEMIASLADEG